MRRLRGEPVDPVFSSTIVDAESDASAYFSSSRLRAGHLAIVRCRACGLLFTSPRDDDGTLARVYGGLVDTEYFEEDDNRRRKAEDYFRLIAADRHVPARLLDVGCATGAFASIAASKGWTVTGLDASPWAIARARERCLTATFVEGLVEDFEAPPASFDVITLWDVLEHVRSPVETIRRLHHWLAPGGSLYLNVPNAESAVARWMGSHWMLLLREHLWYFTPRTIERVLSQGGFQLMRTRPNRVRFSVANIVRRSAQYPNVLGAAARRLAERDVLRRWTKRWTIRFPIGEMNVVARRKD